MTEQVYRQSVAAWMKEQRKALELSREDVALRLGVSPSSVRNWECGSASMSAYTERRVRVLFKQERELQEQKRKRTVVTA